jgi:hypothetical protein
MLLLELMLVLAKRMVSVFPALCGVFLGTDKFTSRNFTSSNLVVWRVA